jgi:hypothetical protein
MSEYKNINRWWKPKQDSDGRGWVTALLELLQWVNETEEEYMMGNRVLYNDSIVKKITEMLCETSERF